MSLTSPIETLFVKGISLQNIRQIQFIIQFFFLSKYGEQSPIFAQFLIGVEAIKVVFKLSEFYKHRNIYMENIQKPEQIQPQKNQKGESSNKVSRIKFLLEKVKKAQHTKCDFQSEMVESLSSGKKLQLITSTKIPSDLKKTRIKFWELFAQLLSIFRPFLVIIAIRIFSQDVRAYAISLLIDIFILFLQRKLKVGDKFEEDEIDARRKQLFYRYLFKAPFFDIFKQKIIEPCLKMIMKESRLVYRLLMYILQMQSSITLTL